MTDTFRIADIVSRLDATKPYRRASSPDATYLHILGASQRHGIYEPFEGGARALNDWLQSVQAGRDLCRDALAIFVAQRPDMAVASSNIAR
jgi:hypothetical protein